MTISINTNISSQLAHVALNASSQRVIKNVERISSGLRVNTAGMEDDVVARQLRAGAKAMSDQAAAMVKAQGQEAQDSVTLQQRAKAEDASAEQLRIDKTQAKVAIKDADFAAEVANFSQLQIRQQAGTSLLAQANSISSQAALSLLR